MAHYGKLVGFYDLREWDDNGNRMPLMEGEGHKCDRCGKIHAKVYEIENEGKVFKVGSTCCKRMFGWVPPWQLIVQVQREKRIAAKKAKELTKEKHPIPYCSNSFFGRGSRII